MVGLAPGEVPRVREEAKTKAASSSTLITIREPQRLHDRKRRHAADLVTRRNRTCGLRPGLASERFLHCMSSLAVLSRVLGCTNSCTLDIVQEDFEVSVSYKRSEKLF
jgi:hypothetical protein